MMSTETCEHLLNRALNCQHCGQSFCAFADLEKVVQNRDEWHEKLCTLRQGIRELLAMQVTVDPRSDPNLSRIRDRLIALNAGEATPPEYALGVPE
jgi:hypothetical protein